MTSKQDFTDQEWSRSRAPLVAGVAISLADPGKEGGFLGFGGQQVSAGEQQILEQGRAALEMA